jgi:5-methylcytosine-specific restriction protein A
MCVHCEEHGEDTAATVVDHIIPHKGDKRLFWDIKNWQPLCASCHGIKTAKEDGGFGN